ncbi:DUF3604 domain-containing protein [Marinibaculum pumilum]|uniref:DUF3604 domain-containing protein n=1 Tax=Marinibaculum pumilum TaxID=1766165 RepID=A0ABV7KZL6_9PROT
MASGYRILFGDIHNHNACGYGVGSMERSIEIARSHLDFFAFTGHSSWHDMVPMEGGREQHWIKGFEKLRDAWPNVQDLIAGANDDDRFSAFLGFEWHSSHFGDQCVVFPDDHQPIAYAQDVGELRAFCREKQALMIPHHLGYPQGRRGVNWEIFDEACTPVVEIFSEHGNSEHDRGPFDFFNHSMGGRQTAQTVRHALRQGRRFGFCASSDSHNGFPGAYGEGLIAVLSERLDRPAIIEAINARRTYAITGDRIEVDFTVGGAVMGASIDAGREVEVAYDVRGRDELDVVEVVQDGEVVHRSFPGNSFAAPGALGDTFQVRLEWGWGPWGDLALERVCDWQFDVAVADGRIARAFPCLQSGPFDPDRRHRIAQRSERELSVRSYTSRRGAYRLNPNQSLVLELEGGAETQLTLTLAEPAAQTVTVSAAELLAGSHNSFTGPFPKESWQWHRIVPRSASALSDRCTLPVPQDRPGHVYLRVRQMNGHVAWISPVFLNYR